MTRKHDKGFSGLDIRGLDVDVRETLLQGAVKNKAALTAKQRWDRKRKRRTFDLNPQVITALQEVAAREKVSMSRLANYLLAHGLLVYFEHPEFVRELNLHKRPVYTSQFDWVPEIPEAWLARLKAHLEALKNKKGWGLE